MSDSSEGPTHSDPWSGHESRSPGDDTGSAPPPPLLPQLVSAQSPQPTVPKPSPYLKKLASMPKSYLLKRPKPRPYTYEPTYYFFYGTLTYSNILQGVFGHNVQPALRPAWFYGYELAKWGQQLQGAHQ